MKTTLVKEKTDEIVLELVHAGSMMQRGKTISAYMFPEATQAIQKLIDDECIKARIDEAEKAKDGWERSVNDSDFYIRMSDRLKELTATESPLKKGGKR